MKVCTDSCLFGAYTAQKLKGIDNLKIADVGTGTGLLTLMLAQQIQGNFTAIEIDSAAAAQAAKNVAGSGFKGINIITGNVFDLPRASYDVIICNPPFFADDLKSEDEIKNRAKHDTSFTLEKFAPWCNNNLAGNGKIFVLLPPFRAYYFTALLKDQGLFCNSKLHIFTKEGGKHLRTVLVLCRSEASAVLTEEIFIKDPGNKYSEAFALLLQDYYLIF